MEETTNGSLLQPGKLLTDRQIAAALGISRSHVWALVKAKKLPAPLKLSERTTRWRSDAIIATIEAREAA